MLNGTIIVNQTLGHNDFKINRFFEEAKNLDINLNVIANNGTIAHINENGDIICDLKTDFIIYLDKDIYLARLLEKLGYRLFNKADFIKICDDKVLTYITCSKNNIRMVPTYAGPLFYDNKLNESNYEFLNTIEKEFGYPMVVKKVYGSLGEGVYLVNNKEQLRDLYSKIAYQPILFQKYISTSYGRSVRVLIIDGKVFGAFERYNTKDFRSNYSTSATSKSIKNKEFLEFAQQIADKLQIEYAGIDLLYGENNEPILCEINSNAFFEEFEKVTGLNAAKEFLFMVKNKYEQELQRKK